MQENATDHVILVDQQDQELGTMEKMEAHREGRLHRAFSVFVYNSQGELMLQQRALSKYHSGGLWTNTCCSHPRPGESLEQAIHRRMQEEMGFDCPMSHAFSFVYHKQVGELIEHELDHVFVGTFDGVPELNPEEVMAYKFVHPSWLRQDMETHPDHYTEWFKLCYAEVEKRRAGTGDSFAGHLSFIA